MATKGKVIEVGDEFALNMGAWNGYRIFTVKSISPSCRITIESGHHVVTLNPDGRVRGERDRKIYGLQACAVTDQVRQSIAIHEAVRSLESLGSCQKLTGCRYRHPEDPELISMLIDTGARAKALMAKLKEQVGE